MTDSPHPAQSPEFLSRLHDLELSPAEAVAFEEHRRSCESCREAVRAYEQTLSLFRAAPTAPPASDLSARILRKIRAQSPSRRPFGVMFGIDIRWAGAFATALVVVIIATSLPQTKSSVRVAAAPTAGPLQAYLVDGVDTSSESDDRPAPRRESDAEKAREKARENAPAPPSNSLPADKEDSLASPREVAASAPPPDARPSAAESPATRETLSAQKTEAKAPAKVLRRQTAYADPAGGEAGASAMAERGLALRLLVSALDSQGAPPPLEAGVADERLAPLRGREFVLLIESQGRVRSVEVSRAREEGALNKKDRADDADAVAQEAPDLEALRELRFRPGDRPRRLLVRVE
jgi:hypothetical protein